MLDKAGYFEQAADPQARTYPMQSAPKVLSSCPIPSSQEDESAKNELGAKGYLSSRAIPGIYTSRTDTLCCIRSFMMNIPLKYPPFPFGFVANGGSIAGTFMMCTIWTRRFFQSLNIFSFKTRICRAPHTFHSCTFV